MSFRYVCVMIVLGIKPYLHIQSKIITETSYLKLTIESHNLHHTVYIIITLAKKTLHIMLVVSV